MKSNKHNYIKRLKHKKEDALEYIMEEYFPLVKGIVRRTLSSACSSEQMEECISDVFLAVWNHGEKFMGEEEVDFRKWICAVAKYRAIDFYRKEKACREVSVSDQEELHVMLKDVSAEEQFFFNENIKEVEVLLNSLPSVDKKIVMMKFFLGMSADEIAKKMKLTKAAVENRIYRGKKQLVSSVREIV